MKKKSILANKLKTNFQIKEDLNLSKVQNHQIHGLTRNYNIMKLNILTSNPDLHDLVEIFYTSLQPSNSNNNIAESQRSPKRKILNVYSNNGNSENNFDGFSLGKTRFSLNSESNNESVNSTNASKKSSERTQSPKKIYKKNGNKSENENENENGNNFLRRIQPMQQQKQNSRRTLF